MTLLPNFYFDVIFPQRVKYIQLIAFQKQDLAHCSANKYAKRNNSLNGRCTRSRTGVAYKIKRYRALNAALSSGRNGYPRTYLSPVSRLRLGAQDLDAFTPHPPPERGRWLGFS